jgi:adenosylcobinamide kinase/adenosylcobinamide-phosphate guanylyltransferase
MSITLVLGGARSGKSRFAESLAASPRTYIATAQAFDSEMTERIALHKLQRGNGWTTVEEQIDLPQALRKAQSGFVLIDCLTLWLSNLMLADQDWHAPLDELIAELHTIKSDVVLVSNEVGLGIVPDTPLGRSFRDAQGITNQRVAQAADNVVMMIAGLAIAIKGPLPTPQRLQTT